MRILIIGNGFLGSKLYTRLEDNDVYMASLHGKNCIQLDMFDADAVHTLYQVIKPELTILTAAMTNVDECEQKPELARRINSFSIINFIVAINFYGGKIIYISTDNVFDGTKGNYIPEDKPNPINVYGRTKLEGERTIINYNIPYLILRTSVLYGWGNSRFFSWCYENLNEGREIKISKEYTVSPTLVDDLVNFIHSNLDFKENKILHVCGREAVTKYEFAIKIAKVFNFDQNLIKEATDFKQIALRPKNSSMITCSDMFKNVEDGLQYLR